VRNNGLEQWTFARMSLAKKFPHADSAVDYVITRVKNNPGARMEKKRGFALYTYSDSQ